MSLCPGGISVQWGSLSRGVSVQGGFLSSGGLCPGGLYTGGSLSRGSLSRGVSVQGQSLYRVVSVRETNLTVMSGRYASYWNASCSNWYLPKKATDLFKTWQLTK